jgi:hypothetical protein
MLDPLDIKPCGAPERTIRSDDWIEHGLVIACPWGVGTVAILTIKATLAGVITMSIQGHPWAGEDDGA